MARFDLNGNPLPEDLVQAPQSAGGGGGGSRPGAAPHSGGYDLAGNPLPMPAVTAPPAATPASGAPYAPPVAVPRFAPVAPAGNLNGAPTAPVGVPAPPGPAAVQGPIAGARPTPGSAAQAPAAQGAPYYAKSRAADPNKVKNIVLGSLTLVVLGACAYLAVLIFNPPPVPAPAGYHSYVAPDQAFAVDVPDGWLTSTDIPTTGKESAQLTDGVRFASGTASIVVAQGTATDENATSVMRVAATVAASSDNPADLAFGRYHVLADGHLADFAEGGRYYFTTSGFGMGVSTTFTASRPAWGLGGPIKGYYVSIADEDGPVIVLCQCREKDWDALKMVFQHVVNSLSSQDAAHIKDHTTDKSVVVQ